MYITCKQPTVNIKVIDNLIIVPPNTVTLLMASCADWLDLTAVWSSFWIGEATACLLAVSDGMICIECATGILILTYKFRTANKNLPLLRIFVYRNTWHPFAEHWGSAESGLRNISLYGSSKPCVSSTSNLQPHSHCRVFYEFRRFDMLDMSFPVIGASMEAARAEMKFHSYSIRRDR